MDRIPELYEACLSYRENPRALAGVSLILVVSILNGVVVTWLAALALGMDIPLLYFFLFSPIISFLGLLPISANGIGISEGGFVVLFTRVGATSAEALTLALAMRLLIMVGTLPGGLLLAVERWPVRHPVAAKSAGEAGR